MKFSRVLGIFTLVLVTGCWQQRPENVQERQEYSSKFNREKAECSKITFHDKVFTQKNLVGMFGCLGWNSEYPRVTKFLGSFNDAEFDSFAAAYNKKFFKNRQTEEKYYNLLRKTNNDRFIKDTQKLLLLLSDEKRLQLFDELITVTEDTNWLISDAFLDLLVRFFEVRGKLGDLTHLREYGDFFTRPDIRESLESMAGEFFKVLPQALNRTQMLDFIQSGDWPEHYLKALRGEHVVQMNLIFRDDYVTLTEHIKTMQTFANSDGICRVGSQDISINHTLELYQRGRSIVDLSPQELLFDIAEMVEKFGLYKNICNKNSSNVQYIQASETLLKKSLRLLGTKGALEFFKKLLEIKLTDEPGSMLSFLDIFTSDFFGAYHNVVSHMDFEGKTGVYEVLLRAARKLDNDDYRKLKGTLDRLGKGLEGKPRTVDFVVERKGELILDLYRDIMINNMSFGSAAKAFLELADFMPKSEQDKKFVTEFFLSFVQQLKDPEFKKELVKFLSRDSLYQFTALIGQGRKPAPVRVRANKVQPYQFSYDLFTPDCLRQVTQLQNVDFDSLVQSDVWRCSSKKPDYFFYNVYEWTSQLDALFQGQFNHRFSINYGVVSPEMMGFYLNLVLTANEFLARPDGNYIRDAIFGVKKVIEDQQFITLLKKSLKVANDFNHRLDLVSEVASTVSRAHAKKSFSNKRIRQLIKKSLETPPVAPEMMEICKQLTPGTEYLGCLTKEQVVQTMQEVSVLLTEKNNKGQNTVKYILDMLYGQDFTLPVAHLHAKPYTLKFSELLDFFNHARSDQTKSEVFVHRIGSVKKLSLPLSERLEILIRDISFNNNFYGIFFMNTASKAYDYMGEMRSLRSQLKLMAGSSGIFRRFRVFNQESSWKFKNVWNTYQSLLDLNGPFRNADGQNHSYTKLIQGIMVSTVKASNLQTIDFHPYRLPNPSLVKGHKGFLITKLSEISFISRMGMLLERMGSQVDLDRKERMDALWEQFTQKIERKKFEEFLNYVLVHPNLPLMVGDLYDVQEKMDPVEVNALLNIATSFLQSYLKQTKQPLKVFDLIKVAIENYPTIKQNFRQALQIEGLVNMHLIDHVFNQDWVNDLLADLMDGLVTKDKEIEAILLDREFSEEVSGTILQLSRVQLGYDMQILKDIFLHERIDWMVLIEMLHRVKHSALGTSYLDNVLEMMSATTEQGQNKFEIALKTIFSDPDALESFLRNVFEKVQFSPVQ